VDRSRKEGHGEDLGSILVRCRKCGRIKADGVFGRDRCEKTGPKATWKYTAKLRVGRREGRTHLGVTFDYDPRPRKPDKPEWAWP